MFIDGEDIVFHWGEVADGFGSRGDGQDGAGDGLRGDVDIVDIDFEQELGGVPVGGVERMIFGEDIGRRRDGIAVEGIEAAVCGFITVACDGHDRLILQRQKSCMIPEPEDLTMKLQWCVGIER